MSTKIKKATITPEATTEIQTEVKPKPVYVKFWDPIARKRTGKTYNIATEDMTACVGQVEVSRKQKREKDKDGKPATRVTYSYIRILLKRPINGEMVVVKDLSVGIAKDTGALYMKENELETAASAPASEVC